MRIIIDAFGGDNAPAEVIKGARRAKDELDVEITLVGDCERIKSQASQIGVELNGSSLPTPRELSACATSRQAY